MLYSVYAIVRCAALHCALLLQQQPLHYFRAVEKLYAPLPPACIASMLCGTVACTAENCPLDSYSSYSNGSCRRQCAWNTQKHWGYCCALPLLHTTTATATTVDVVDDVVVRVSCD
eukprot:11835-Heterococcus_DN1.PRE.1